MLTFIEIQRPDNVQSIAGPTTITLNLSNQKGATQ